MPDLQFKHSVTVIRMYSFFQKITLPFYRSYMRLIVTKISAKLSDANRIVLYKRLQ